METVYRLFMYILPFAVSLAFYIWMLQKARRVPHKVAKIVSLVIIVGGLGYTVYKIVKSIPTALTNDDFEYAIMIVTIAVLFIASIIMAFGEPEKPSAISHQPSAESKKE